MIKFQSSVKNTEYLIYRWVSLVKPSSYIKYFVDLYTYSKLPGAEKINLTDTYPVIDSKKYHPFDRHYFYQDAWAAKKIYLNKPTRHVDIGSNLEFIGLLTSFTKVTFVDIRKLNVNLPNFESIKGSILNLPFKTNSIKSISCLHVAEHIGLGRYGDPLDPQGTKKACKELTRVLIKGGNLYFSLPIGKPRLCFNAHRIHSPKEILRYFDDLKLIELSGVTDDGKFIKNVSIKLLERSDYACGLFWFKK